MLVTVIFRQLYAQYLYSIQIHKQIIKSVGSRLVDTISSLKRRAFNFLLKVSLEMDFLINLGRTFHNLVAANRETRSPRVALGSP